MAKVRSDPSPTLALNTKVEEDFVAPLTSVRGALEILRDYPDLSETERQRFLNTALRSCAHLERGIEDLANTVYAAGQRDQDKSESEPQNLTAGKFQQRIQVHEDEDIIEVDFSDFEFDRSETVNAFYDVIEETIEATGHAWYILVNYHNCSVWPEAWIAFAHRGKQVNVTYSRGTIRYASRASEDAQDYRSDSYDPDLFDSREAALARIEELKKQAAM